MTRFKDRSRAVKLGAFAALVLFVGAAGADASSHMDAPLITEDPAANTTDVYAFVTRQGELDYLTTALAVYPFEEPGIGPNKYNFSDDVVYALHVSLGEDLAKGLPTVSYEFSFKTTFKNENTILQSFQPQASGVSIEEVDDAAQNLTQRYTVTQVDRREKKKQQRSVLGAGVVPPNNQGRVTPYYNQGDNGENPARPGVASSAQLDRYTTQTVTTFPSGHMAFAGQRDDGFYADIQAVFDALNLRSGEGNSFDSQGGFNLHTIALNIPIASIGGDMQQVGVFATTSRRKNTSRKSDGDKSGGKFVQVARQGNPLFCEAFIPLKDKDAYNRSLPSADAELFAQYANTPELAKLVNLVVFGGVTAAIETERTDLAGIFIPDVIRVDLSTGPVRLAGGGSVEASPANPDDAGFSRLGLFGPGAGDTVFSKLRNGNVPSGWPNGRRFGDDVTDIAICALLSDLRDPANLVVSKAADGIDNVGANDIAFSKVFPYAATPHNGRVHNHHKE